MVTLDRNGEDFGNSNVTYRAHSHLLLVQQCKLGRELVLHLLKLFLPFVEGILLVVKAIEARSEATN